MQVGFQSVSIAVSLVSTLPKVYEYSQNMYISSLEQNIIFLLYTVCSTIKYKKKKFERGKKLYIRVNEASYFTGTLPRDFPCDFHVSA